MARGHLLAAHSGYVGERYILGCQNRSLTEIFNVLESVTGIRAPPVRAPCPDLSRGPGQRSRGARLGLPRTALEQVLREAVDRFVAHGYAPPLPPAYRARVA